MRRLSRLINRHRNANWALADQSVVSGSNFITGILLARFLGPEAFGFFVVLQSVMLYFNTFQGALIFQPMLSAAPQLTSSGRQQYLQGVFALQLMLTFGLAVIAAVLSLFADALFGFAGLTPPIVIALTAALVGFQLQDWQRRYYFVRENARAAFFNDMFSYGGQTALLLLASFGDYLNVANAFWIIAVTTTAAFIIGIANDRLLPMFTHARAVLNEGWRAGRDYLAAWQFQLLGTQGVFMIGAGAAGTQAVGGVRATQNIVGPINILFQAMENLIPIKAARRYASSGIPGLKRFLWRLTLLGTALLVPVLLLLSLFATPLIHALYGEKYMAFVSLVYWQALYVFIQFYQRQTFFFLRTIKATGVILRASVLIAILSLVVAALTIHRFHEVGIMMALLSGSSGGLLYALFEARKLTHAMSTPVSPPHVSTIHQFQRPHQCQEQT